MAHRPREDAPGVFHHVMARGLAKRWIFGGTRDARFFQSRLARVVRGGGVRVHAFSLLTNHYHLLVESRTGELSRNIGWVQREYARWFNARRGRDGPLFRGRFRSRRIIDEFDWQNVVRYIDQNGVEAGLATHASRFPLGSAFYHVRRKGRPWLERSAIHAMVCPSAAGPGSVADFATAYFEVFGRLAADDRWLVERRLEYPCSPDPIGDALRNGSDAMIDKMRRAELLADGATYGFAAIAPGAVARAVSVLRDQHGDWVVSPNGRGLPAWRVLHSALLRLLSGLSWREVAERLNTTDSSVKRWVGRHPGLLGSYPRYAERCRRAIRIAGAKDPGVAP